MDTPHYSPEYTAFRLLFANLARSGINPLSLAVELFSEGVVDEDDKEKAGLGTHSTLERNSHLLSTVHKRIVADPKAYEKLRKILDSEPCYRHLADLMTKTLDEVKAGLHQGRFQQLEHPSILHSYIQYLKEYYRSHFTRPGGDGKWPRIQIERYIELAVATNIHSSEEEMVQFSISSATRGIDEFLEYREKIRIAGIACLKRNGEPHKGVLIVGAPGIGKTSLVRQLCLEWAQGKLLQQYDLVLLLLLRDRYVLEAKDIGEIIDPDDPTHGQEIFRQMRENNGRRTLLIFDGYDEAPVELEGSVVQRLMQGKSLPKATVLITSRPTAAGDLVRSQCFDQKLEVLGFTLQNICQYAEATFGETSDFHQFFLYLISYPHILAMMYNPLNCAIVTEAYKFELDQQFPPRPLHRITDLYINLTLSLLSRYSSVKYTDYTDLPQDVADRFWRLAKLAYDKLLEKQFVFTGKSVPEDLLLLGFFQSYLHLYSHKDASPSHSFLHLTLQEYLAALYVSRCSDGEQYAFVEMTANAGTRKSFDFLAGLTQLSAFQPEQLVECSPSLLPNIFICGNQNISTSLTCALFETQSFNVINNVFNYMFGDHPVVAIAIFNDPFHSYVTGYLFAMTQNHTWRLVLDLDSIHDEPELCTDGVHFFRHGFEAGGGQCRTQVTVELVIMPTHHKYITGNDIRFLLELPHFILENVLILHLFIYNIIPSVVLRCKYTPYQLACLWKVMTGLQSFHLMTLFSPRIAFHLHLFLNTPGTFSLLKTIHIIAQFNNLRPAHLFFLSKIQHATGSVPWLEVDIVNEKRIELKLLLSSDSEDKIKLFPRCFLSAYYNFHMYTPYSYQVSLGMLNTVSHLSTISMTGGEQLHCPQKCFTLLCHALHSNLLPTVSSLDLSHTTTSSTIISHLSPALPHNHHLLSLRLAHCSLSLKALSSLTFSLQCNRSLRELDLSGNRVVSRRRAVEKLASLLSHCRLRTVVLRHCDFSPIRAHQLATALHKQGVLEHAHLTSDLVIILHQPASTSVPSYPFLSSSIFRFPLHQRFLYPHHIISMFSAVHPRLL